MVLEEYDRQVRQQPSFFDPAYRLEREGTVVRLSGAQPTVKFSGEGVDIDRQLQRFEGRSVRWQWHSHDKPADLRQRLLDKGFASDGEPAAVLSIEVPDWIHKPALDVRRLGRDESLAPLIEVHQAIWPGYGWLYESLERERRAKPDAIHFYVAYNVDRPVGSSWMRFAGDFAGFFGGAVLPEARGHGYYRAMVAARLMDAKGRARWAYTSAWSMSRPVLDKLGWRKLTDTEWLVRPAARPRPV